MKHNFIILFLCFTLFFLENSEANSERLTFMTGPAGGTWYPLGGAVKQILEQEIPNLEIIVRPGAGLINIKGISKDKAELAWGNVISTVDALGGRPPFKEAADNLCNLAAFYYQYAQIPVTDPDISSIADLQGKSVGTLPRGNTTEVAARNILALYGILYENLKKINFEGAFCLSGYGEPTLHNDLHEMIYKLSILGVDIKRVNDN